MLKVEQTGTAATGGCRRAPYRMDAGPHGRVPRGGGRDRALLFRDAASVRDLAKNRDLEKYAGLYRAAGGGRTTIRR